MGCKTANCLSEVFQPEYFRMPVCGAQVHRCVSLTKKVFLQQRELLPKKEQNFKELLIE